jgi:hypothetical protein
MLVTVRVALKTGVAANVRSPIRPHVGTDHVIRPPRRPDRVAVGLLCEPQGTRSVGARGRNRAEHRPEAHLDAVGVESIVDVWPKYLQPASILSSTYDNEGSPANRVPNSPI